MFNRSALRQQHISDDASSAASDLLEDDNVERGDTESIFKELGDTIDVDFHTALLDLKNSPEINIWPNLYEIVHSLHRALDILHQKEPRHSGLKSASRHAFLELRGYSLLMCEQELLEEFEPHKETSTLANLICENTKFRQIYALWKWCQDSEAHDSGSFGDLANEYASLTRCQNARSGSLRALTMGQKKFGLDIDAPAPEEDRDFLARHIRVVFSSIRSCKIDEAIQLAHDNGLAALAAPIRLYKFLVDPALSPLDPQDENHQIAKRWLHSAKLLRRMVDSPKADNYSRMLWAAITGRLQPLLSMATRTTDRLWCFANAAIMNMLLEACTGQTLEDVPTTIESIFAEITAEEKSPYYSIYPYLLRDDWDGLIGWLVDYVATRLDTEAHMDDQLVRFIAALAAVARIKQHQHDEVAAKTLFAVHMKRLVEKSLFGIIPFYASFLPRQTAEDRLQAIMKEVRGNADRGEYLLALESSDFDRDEMAVAAAADTGDNLAVTRVDNLRWLLINGERTLDSCVVQINNLVRHFMVADEQQIAYDVLAESIRFEIPEKLNTTCGNRDALPATIASNIAEYECHRLFHFEAFPLCEKFSEQAIYVKRLVADMHRPSTSTLNFREVGLQQATVLAVKDIRRQDEIARCKSSSDVLKGKIIEILEKMLVHKGMYCKLDQPQRVEELDKVRNLCCCNIVEIYLASCNAIGDHQAVIDAGILLAKSQTHVERVFTKENLRRIMKQIDDFSNSLLH